METRLITISDIQLIVAIGGLVVLDVIVLVIWTLAFPYSVHESSSVDCAAFPGRYIFVQFKCIVLLRNACHVLPVFIIDTGTTSMIFVQVAIKGSISAYGTYLTYLIRNVPSEYNERYNVTLQFSFLIIII